MSNAILGIDIGKKEIVTALLINDKLIGKKSFTNDNSGFKSLDKWLNQKEVSSLKACMESTGNYGNNLAQYLYEQKHQVHVVNPACIKAFAKSKLMRTKTDAVDAHVIALYANLTKLNPYKPPSPAYKELKALHRCLNDLKSQSV